MGWNHLGVFVLGLCCAAHVVWGQGYVNIAPGKTYNQSSPYNSHRASNAADSNTDRSPFFESEDNNAFWEVDLGRKYPVHNITVWSVNSGSNDNFLFPYTITVDGQHCVSVSSKSTSARNNSVTCSSIIYGQKVRITKTATERSFLSLSEFEILACTPGLYGDNCTQTCRPSKCLDNTCHPDTGLCIECGGNFNGSTCSECKAGYYRSGDSCYPCSSLCAGSQCDPSNGSCIGCVDGRHGATCNTTCSPAGCQTCHQHSGQCTACRPLYNLDPTSQCKACKDGFSKHNSIICSPCSSSCKDRKCNGDTGDCTQGIKDESSQLSSGSVVGAILGAGLMLTVAVLSVLVFLCWKHRSQKTDQDAETVAASPLDPVTTPNNVYTAPPTASPSISAQACDVTPHEIRDPGNTYEKLRIYSNMVFDREAHSEPEPRGTDVTKAL